MTEPFSVNDRRQMRRTASGLWVGNPNAEMRRLRQANYTLPNSNVQARIEAKRVAETVERGSLVDMANRATMNDMRKSAGMMRTGSNMQMALPKVRQPLSTLMDKGIPFNIQDPKELIELRRWCRLFYSTHDLVPLLIDIYSKFPVVGLEFQCKDTKIRDFYESMFMDELNYGEFLSDGLGREYFTVGEVTALAHFNESLGIWSSEEILNPDMIQVSKSLFVQRERVQLMVKQLVEDLRTGPAGAVETDESPSQRLERNWEYQQLVKYYPEVIKAAAQDDGLDMSDALVSRLVNKASWTDLRGTPHLLRSFRTLMMEESLNAAQDAVADRLYSPLILATMGIPDMGDGGGAWIPDQAQLDNLRDDMQTALAADFKLMVHNFGVQVQSVFGRESVPRFDTDYDRVDAKLLQAWGIGQALIAGGTSGGGAYASSALNREVCEQLMLSFQNKVRRHMIKRMEIIAEAQEHYDFEMKGGEREPIYREIVQENEETGEEEIVRVPKLLIPEIKFATLNLRDESTERAFIAQLKQMGVPISDGTLALNIPIEFEQELEKQAEETVSKGIAQAQAMSKLQQMCDAEDLPYPAELAQHLEMTLQLRQMLAQTKMLEEQEKITEQQVAQASPAGMMGLLPGTMAQPMMQDPNAAQGGAVGDANGDGDVSQQEAQTAEFGLLQQADQEIEQEAATLADPAAAGQPMMQPQQMVAAMMGPQAQPPQADPPGGRADQPKVEVEQAPPELARNRQRPEESDDQRASMPKSAAERYADRLHRGPSSYGRSKRAKEERVRQAVKRREALARGVTVGDLVHDPDFYATLNAGAYESQIRADWPEIQAGGGGESRKLLEEMIQQYEEVTGITPRW